MNIEEFFRDVEGNMFEDIMHNHVGLPHLLPAPEKNSSNNDLVENDDDQIVSESSNSAVFPQISFLCTLTKCPQKRRTMSFQNFEKFRLKKQPLLKKQPRQPLARPTKPNTLRPAVHKSQHHSSIASRQQSLVSSVSDSESSAIETVAASEADLVDLYPFNGGYSVMGVDAESAVGLLGLLLFIDLMRDVMQTVASGRRRKKRRRRRNLFQT